MSNPTEIAEHLRDRYGDAVTVTTHHALHRHVLVIRHDEEETK